MIENVTLEWLGRTLADVGREQRAVRNDLDMLIRMVTRLDHSVDALREDIRSLWLDYVELRRRFEALEGSDKLAGDK